MVTERSISIPRLRAIGCWPDTSKTCAADTKPAATHNAKTARRHNASLWSCRSVVVPVVSRLRRPVIRRSNTKHLGIPFQPQLARRCHVADQRRGSDHGRAREVAVAAETHTVLPIAIEGRDRALAG